MRIAYYTRDKLLKLGASDVLVKYGQVEASHVKFSNNQIVKTGSEVLESLSVFASFNGRLVFTNLKNLNEKAADELIKQMSKFVKHVPVNKEYKGIAQERLDYRPLEQGYDK